MILRKYAYGKMENMELSAFKWWNSKRKEYNFKFIANFLAAQFIFILMAIGFGNLNYSNVFEIVISIIKIDIWVIILINVIYYLWPLLEITVFKPISLLYRRLCFGFINIMSLLMPLAAVVIMIRIKA